MTERRVCERVSHPVTGTSEGILLSDLQTKTGREEETRRGGDETLKLDFHNHLFITSLCHLADKLTVVGAPTLRGEDAAGGGYF